MNMLFEIVEIAACYIDSLLVFKVFGELLHKQARLEKEKREIWAIIIGMLITWLCNQNALFSVFTMLIFVIYASLSGALLYKTNILSLLSIVSFYIVCMSCVEFFLLSVISSFGNGGQTLIELISVTGLSRTIYIIFVKSIWGLIYVVFRKYLYMFTEKVSYGYTVLIISIIGFVGVVFLIYQTCSAFNYELTGIWLIFVLILVFIIFSTYYVVAIKNEKLKLEFANAHNSLLEENYKTISNIYKSNAKIYHDMNNHLSVLYQLVHEGNYDKAKEYISQIGEPIKKLSKTIWTGNDIVDVVINSKIEKMRQKGIVTDLNVELINDDNISPHDTCIILANLLDNAIEASEKLDEPGQISITIRRIKQFLLIQVSNLCNEMEKSFSVFPETTKNDKVFHGWGLSNVKESVEKYNGTMEIENEGDRFTVTILLFFENMNEDIITE